MKAELTRISARAGEWYRENRDLLKPVLIAAAVVTLLAVAAVAMAIASGASPVLITAALVSGIIIGILFALWLPVRRG